MYTLYYIPGSCSMAVHVALLEISVPFKLENVSVPTGQPRPAHYLKINPRGSVPTLVMDDFAIREGMAILTFLLDTHLSPLLPRDGHARALALEWLAFANATLHPAYGTLFMMHKELGEEAAQNPLYEKGVQKIQRLWDDVEQRLNQSEYLAGGQCSIADILITVIANWTFNLKKSVTFGDKTKALLRRVIARPAYQKAITVEQVTYKAAA